MAILLQPAVSVLGREARDGLEHFDWPHRLVRSATAVHVVHEARHGARQRLASRAAICWQAARLHATP